MDDLKAIQKHCKNIQEVHRELEKAKSVEHRGKGNVTFVCEKLDFELSFNLEDNSAEVEPKAYKFVFCLLNFIGDKDDELHELKQKV